MLEILKDLDFTEGEIRVYKALLSLKESTIGPISKVANIAAAKTYPVLDKLLKKGLIAQVKKDRTVHFYANEPERLLTYIDEKKNNLVQKQKVVEKELPRLKKLKLQTVTDARVLQGYEGFKTFYEEHNRILKKGSGVFKAFSFEDDWKKQEVRRFIHKQDIIRKEMGIKVQILAQKRIKKYLDKHTYDVVDIRFTSQEIPVGTAFINPISK